MHKRCTCKGSWASSKNPKDEILIAPFSICRPFSSSQVLAQKFKDIMMISLLICPLLAMWMWCKLSKRWLVDNSGYYDACVLLSTSPSTAYGSIPLSFLAQTDFWWLCAIVVFTKIWPQIWQSSCHAFRSSLSSLRTVLLHVSVFCGLADVASVSRSSLPADMTVRRKPASHMQISTLLDHVLRKASSFISCATCSHGD